MGANPQSLLAATRAHAETARDLQAAGVRFTSQRNGLYATSALSILGQGLQTGEVRLPADGPVSWTAHGHLADAAVIALTQDGRLNGITRPSPARGARLRRPRQDRLGTDRRQITRTAISDDDHVAGLFRAGSPQAYAGMALSIFTASRRGEFATVDPTLGWLLGRPHLRPRRPPIRLGQLGKRHHMKRRTRPPAAAKRSARSSPLTARPEESSSRDLGRPTAVSRPARQRRRSPARCLRRRHDERNRSAARAARSEQVLRFRPSEPALTTCGVHSSSS